MVLNFDERLRFESREVPHNPLQYTHCKCFLDFTHALVLIIYHGYNVYGSVCMCIL